MKKIMSGFLCLVMILTLNPTAFAADQSTPVRNIPEAPVDYGAPISETVYYDEELEATVTERTFFVPDVSATINSTNVNFGPSATPAR